MAQPFYFILLGGVKGKIGFPYVDYFVGLVKVLGLPKGELGCYFRVVIIKKTTLSIPRLCYG